MNIDERLDKLTGCQEALTQSLELLVHSQREAYEKQREATEKNLVLMAHILESVESLARRNREIAGER